MARAGPDEPDPLRPLEAVGRHDRLIPGTIGGEEVGELVGLRVDLTLKLGARLHGHRSGPLSPLGVAGELSPTQSFLSTATTLPRILPSSISKGSSAGFSGMSITRAPS